MLLCGCLLDGAAAPCHCVLQHARRDRMPFGVIAVEEAVRRRRVDGHQGKLPPQIHRILDAGVEPLAADRVMHMRGVPRQQDSSVAIGRCLPGHVSCPGNPSGAVDSVICSIDGDERVA